MADDTTKISTLPLSENLDDDDLLLVVEDGVSKKAEVGYLKTKFTEGLATVASSGSYIDLSNTPTIPDELADLSDDSTHRTVTDVEKSAWNGKANSTDFNEFKSAVSESTRNINSSEIGRYYVNNSGVIAASTDNYYGMENMVACSANTQYAFSKKDITANTIYIAEYKSDGTFIQRTADVYTLTTTANTAYIYVCFYKSGGVTVGDNPAIQIEKGSSPTGYVPCITATDFIARETTDGIETEDGLNIVKKLTITTDNATYVTDGNGYKVTASSSSNSRMRFTIISLVQSIDVGKTYTISADLYQLGGGATNTRISIMSNNSNRSYVDISTTGKVSITYTITNADVGRKIDGALYACSVNSASGYYSIWHDIQIENLPYATEYSENEKTVIDYTARAKEDYLFDIVGNVYTGLKVRNVTLTGASTQRYTISTNKPVPQIIRCRARCTGGNAAIEFQNGLYSSPVYKISYGSEYEIHSWRVPPALNQDTTNVIITIGQGATVEIDYLYSEVANYNPTVGAAKPEFYSHLGFRQMCPENTRPAVEMAGILGYSACIVVPKVTSDGVLVCIHDDTINATARDSSGNAPSSEMYVSDMTYSQLLEWDFGRYKNAYWAGTKILTVDEFFDICSRYGMKPTFSTHPGLTIEQWQDVKSMLIKHGILSRFNVKAFDMSIINTAYEVFGQSINGYTGEHGSSYVSISDLTNFITTNSIDTSKCHITSEKSVNSITESHISEVLAAGLECGCYTITSSNNAVSIKELMGYGVTSFTDDTYCQNGMDW